MPVLCIINNYRSLCLTLYMHIAKLAPCYCSIYIYMANAKIQHAVCAAESAGCARTAAARCAVAIVTAGVGVGFGLGVDVGIGVGVGLVVAVALVMAGSSSSTLYWHVLKCTRALTFHDTDKQNTPVQHRRSLFTSSRSSSTLALIVS